MGTENKPKTKRKRYYHYWLTWEKNLIDYVKANPVMYDKKITRLNGVRRHVAIEQLWREYSKKTNKPVLRLMKRWKSIHDMYIKKLKNPRKIDKLSKYSDGRLSFMGKLNEPNVFKESVVYLSDEDMEEQPKTVYNKDMLLKTTIVTQDMIEELLKLKSKTENDENVSNCEAEQQICTESDDKMSDEATSTLLESETETSAGLVKSNDDIASSIAKIMVPTAIHKEDLPAEAEDNEIENENSVDFSEQEGKGVMNQHKISTTDFFLEMGDYVVDHFSEEKQKQLRTMLWSLIQEELELLHK